MSSGAVAFGRQRLKQEELLSRPVRSTLLLRGNVPPPAPPTSRACAAVGQAGLMTLYESMFAQYGVSCAQVRGLGAWSLVNQNPLPSPVGPSY